MGGSEEVVRIRWNLAEAAAERGRPHEAISEDHKVYAQLLERGSLVQAAIASVEILGLHLQAGRLDELPSLARKLGSLLRDAGSTIHVMEPLAYLRARIDAERLTHGDVAYVRAFLEEVPVRTTARFRAP